MVQKLIQTQAKKKQQVQRLSQQQMLQVKLLEMPIAELEESVNAEIDDNPALEVSEDEPLERETDAEESGVDDAELSDEEKSEKDDREEALDSALESLGGDDEMPISYGRQDKDNADYEEMIYGDTTSFYDKLKEQMSEVELSEQESQVMEYLIGSLDGDGLLRKDLGSICDELAIYNNVDVSEAEIEEILHKLQCFDPAGIGARSLQERLLLQIDRRPESKLKEYMLRVVKNYFDEFTKKHWDKIQSSLGLNDVQTDTLRDEIRRLNPKPGSSMGETMGRNVQQITPDFIVSTSDDGSVSFSLNYGDLPELKVSTSFAEMVDTYRQNKQNMNRREKEALLYAKEKMEKAQGFIEAVKQRRHTLYVTMKAIIEWQRKYFADGDEAELKPMILKDIAEKTGLDISTISRVSNMKYAQTRWGTFPLRFFFSDSYTTDGGEEMSTRKIKLALKELIDKEDSNKPMSDDALTKLMSDKGFPIARRTIAKYREQMGIPVARLRRK